MINYQIYSDFSDTIAKPSVGDKFPSFELELGKLVATDITSSQLRDVFINESQKTYDYFLSIRRNMAIPYETRMKAWLKPFTNLLTIDHLETLTSTFSFSPAFLEIIKLLERELGTNSLMITVVSGTIWQLIDRFLKSNKVSPLIKNYHVSFEIAATKLVFDEKAKFNGELIVTNKLAYSDADSFPEKCLVIGDNAMENYGFGEKLLNIQSFNTKLVSERVRKYLNKL